MAFTDKGVYYLLFILQSHFCCFGSTCIKCTVILLLLFYVSTLALITALSQPKTYGPP